MVIADARMSWEPSSFRPQDNLQKIYPLGPTGIIGFSGSVVAAKAIFSHLTSKDQRRPLPQTAEQIPIDIGAAAREAYSKLRSRERQDVHLMYAGADYSSIGLVADNMIMARNVMAVMSSPNFEVKNSPDAIRLGYAQHYPITVLIENRNSLMRHGTSEMGRRFQVAIAIGSFAPSLARYAPHRVGGLFTVGVATAEGVGWWPHGSGEDYQLLIEDGKFVQIDHKRGRRIHLKTVMEIDPYRPSSGDLRIDTPEP